MNWLDIRVTVAVFEFDVPAGMKVAAGHSHDGYEETIYGLEGVLTWTVEVTPIEHTQLANVLLAIRQMRYRSYHLPQPKATLSRRRMAPSIEIEASAIPSTPPADHRVSSLVSGGAP